MIRAAVPLALALAAQVAAGPARAAAPEPIAAGPDTIAWATAAAGAHGLSLVPGDADSALCTGSARLATSTTVWAGCPTAGTGPRHVVVYEIPTDAGATAYLLVVVDALPADAAFADLAHGLVIARGAIATAAGLPVPADVGEPPGGRFADDDGDQYEPFHEAVAAAGIVAGCGDAAYCGGGLLARGEMAVMLAAALALPAGGEPFTDTAGHFAADAAARLRASGIAAGCGGGAYCPDAPITRSEAAVLLTRAFDLAPDAPPPGLHAAYGEITLVAGGDILMHTQVTAACATSAGYDCSTLFAAVAPLVAAADVALCHMEVPIAGDERGLSGYPIFNAPEALAGAVAGAGFDVCNTASNHTIDKGADGACRTTQELAATGVATTGSACDAAQRANPPILEVGGVRLAFLAYTYGTNGIPIPQDAPFAVNLIDPATIIADAEAARARGAEFVVVNLHHGTEYVHEPTAAQVAVIGALTASPAIDLVLGQHAHVVQPIARVNGKLVAYGEGNFVSAQSRAGTREGLLLSVTIRRDAAGLRAVHIAYDTVYTGPGYQVIPASRLDELALDPGTAAAVAAAQARTVAVIGTGDGWAPAG